MEYGAKFDDFWKKIKESFGSSVNLKRTLLLTISIATVVILPAIVNVITNYSILLSILLIVLLYLKFVFNEYSTENSFIRFIQKNSIFIIVPLLILFTGIVYNATIFKGVQ